MSEDALAFPIRFRGYDRDAVDWELHELRVALDYAQAERDRAVARALAVEGSDRGGPPASATVQWLIDTAEEDARRIRDEAKKSASEITERAKELLRQRVELIDQAQREADVCRANAAEEARGVVREALEKADLLLRGLRESDAALRELFESGALTFMPPPRGPVDDRNPIMAGSIPAQPSPMPRSMSGQLDSTQHTGPISVVGQQAPAAQATSNGNGAPTVAPQESPGNPA
jgi:ElaB/YqjD/DUF883 family membrane-anchored ribosome-binding protein